MINGLHAFIYAKDADKTRAFFRDVLKFRTVDVGHGWLIFALPPAELGIHPAEGDEVYHELYLMCDDMRSTIADLDRKGVEHSEIRDVGWGVLTSVVVPGGGTLGLYQPKHPTAIATSTSARQASVRKATKRNTRTRLSSKGKPIPKKRTNKRAPRRKQ